MKVEFTDDAECNLKRLGRRAAERVVTKVLWFAEHFEDQDTEALVGKLKGFFKLRVGDWRVIYEVNRGKTLITVHLVDHRSKIYK